MQLSNENQAVDGGELMKEIIVRLARMIRLLHAKGRRVASIKPFGRDIFLLEIKVAGTHYIENMNDIEPSLHVGSRLDFFREPTNPHDSYAIVIQSPAGDKIGYISRRDNLVFARLMDGGKFLFGELKSKEWKGRWLKIKVDVYLRD